MSYQLSFLSTFVAMCCSLLLKWKVINLIIECIKHPSSFFTFYFVSSHSTSKEYANKGLTGTEFKNYV